MGNDSYIKEQTTKPLNFKLEAAQYNRIKLNQQDQLCHNCKKGISPEKHIFDT